MGVVYRATDSRLGREVALKLLPESFAGDSERMARFEREARVLASLSHPNIAGLYGIEESDGRKALVMEYVPGEDLSARVARGPIPIDEALPIAIQVARALEAAHHKGVTHRDLKPANVRITPDGVVKVLDFGLARPGADPSSSSVAIDPRLSQSPTFTVQATQVGVVLGTAAYMSPEQARGRAVDARSDVFSFGCLLFEMVSGARAFAGEDISEILASVIKNDVQWHLLPDSVPEPVRKIIRRCMEPRIDERYQAVGDARIDIARLVADPALLSPEKPVVTAGGSAGSRLRSWIVPAAIAAVAAGLIAFVAGRQMQSLQKPVAHTTRFTIDAAKDATRFYWPRLSPDGRTMAFLQSDSSGTQLIHVRPLASLEASPLLGTDQAGRPFWSPDGTKLAFMVDGKLRTIGIGGGAVELVAEAPGRFDGSWGKGGMILLDGGNSDSLLAVSAAGGSVRPASRLDRTLNEVNHAWPSFLPDGERFLFVARSSGDRLDWIRLGKLGSMESTIVDSCDSRVEYVGPGYILFARLGVLYARKFDLASGKCTGEAFPIVENLGNLANSGDFSGSLTGTIAYRARAGAARQQLMVVDRSGTNPRLIRRGSFQQIAVSPDGTRLAYSMQAEGSGKSDLWVRDLVRGTDARVSFDSANEIWPVWSPDGLRLAFASDRTGDFKPYYRFASGVGADHPIPGTFEKATGVASWGERALTFGYVQNSGDWGAYGVSLADTVTRFPIAEEPGRGEFTPMLSPDGKWVAFESSESGLPQIFVQSFPDPFARHQVSIVNGIDPEWAQGGRELFFRTLTDTIMVSTIAVEGGFHSTIPRAVTHLRAPGGRTTFFVWRPSPDGRQIYFIRDEGGSGAAPITVIVDWVAEIEKKQRR